MRNVSSLITVTLLLLFSPPALARHHIRVRAHNPAPGPHVTVWFDPWVIGAVPDARDGWVWVEGHTDPTGAWVPGHWAPVDPRPGWVWEAGYWRAGGTYVEGYWRPAERAGYVWVGGSYGSRHDWKAGHWVRRR